MSDLLAFLQEHRLQEGSRIRANLHDGTECRGQLHSSTFLPGRETLILHNPELGYYGLHPNSIESLKEVGFGPQQGAILPPKIGQIAPRKSNSSAPASASKKMVTQATEPWLTDQPKLNLPPFLQFIVVDIDLESHPRLQWLQQEMEHLELPKGHKLRGLSEVEESQSSNDLIGLAKEVAKVLSQGVSGVVVLCQLESLGWLSCAMSWMVQFPPVPVLFYGLPTPNRFQPSKTLLDLKQSCEAAIAMDVGELLVCTPPFPFEKTYTFHRPTRLTNRHTTARQGWTSDQPVLSLSPSGYQLHVHDLPPRWSERAVRTGLGWSNDVLHLPFYEHSPDGFLSGLDMQSVRAVLLEGPGDSIPPESWKKVLLEWSEQGVAIYLTSTATSGAHHPTITKDGELWTDWGIATLPPMLSTTALSKLCWSVGMSDSNEEILARMKHQLAGEFLG